MSITTYYTYKHIILGFECSEEEFKKIHWFRQLLFVKVKRYRGINDSSFIKKSVSKTVEPVKQEKTVSKVESKKTNKNQDDDYSFNVIDSLESIPANNTFETDRFTGFGGGDFTGGGAGGSYDDSSNDSTSSSNDYSSSSDNSSSSIWDDILNND